jgi:SAM-dependent methyltransferase
VDPPVPPEALIRRAGWTPGTDLTARYLSDGRADKELLASLVPDAPRVRVLDFGCGSGKTLHHFYDELDRFELHGCDIDGPSIRWLSDNHGAYATFFEVTGTPGLPCPDSSFDLIYAISVFTHLVEHWAAWLLELRRVLAPDGLLAVTTLGEGMIGPERGGEWHEDEIGMNVLRLGQDWEGGGPTVFLSEWWIREHWGRAFEIVAVRTDRHPDGSVVQGSHAMVIMRPRAAALAPADLERIDPTEPRELRALQRNIAQLADDDVALRATLGEERARGDAESAHRVELEREVERLRDSLAVMTNSHSWRITRPLRSLRARRQR